MGWSFDLAAIGAALAGLFIISLSITLILWIMAIWAANTLFNTVIPLTIQTVAAAMIVVFTFGGSKISFKKVD